ncbi:MAG: NAD(P)H-dependent oxidoreductase subunit E [Nitrospirota bacterium]
MEEALERILTNYKKNEGNIITILQDIEETFGYIPEEAVTWFSKRLDIPASRFYGTATFYAQFHLKPYGKNVITVCRGTACHVKGSERLISGLRKRFNLPDGEDTTDDMEFTIERVACVGACGMAPVVLINKKVHGKMTADKLTKETKILESKKTATIMKVKKKI